MRLILVKPVRSKRNFTIRRYANQHIAASVGWDDHFSTGDDLAYLFKTSTQSWCLSFSASSNADLPLVSLILASAPLSSSIFTTSALPRHAAVHSAFLTPSSRALSKISSLFGISLITAPRSSRCATTSVLPCPAALGSAERPFTTAPLSKSASITGIEDIDAASSSALVEPKDLFAFGSAPRESRNWTWSRLSDPTDKLIKMRRRVRKKACDWEGKAAYTRASPICPRFELTFQPRAISELKTSLLLPSKAAIIVTKVENESSLLGRYS